eukprot:TRINITY_DN323_c0_g1_i1.p2 TRINITY_DN323_c0_g1~~TRINITY_DN323_c0_g1_i1.p2  ORF type:complete len:348 (-),score=27.52 TRINITY_DN323_c0_g1_i1:553-1596(-)
MTLIGTSHADMLDYGCASNCGSRYGTLNQDYGVVQPVIDPEELTCQDRQQCFIGAVLDGHGILGQETARYAGKALVRYLCGSDLRTKAVRKWKSQSVQNLLQQAFKWAHLAALSVYEHPPKEVKYSANTGKSSRTFFLSRYKNCQTYSTPLRLGERQEVLLECGTTCSLVVLEGDRLWIANVGDSTIVLGSKMGTQYEGTPITVTHNGLNEGEVKRLRSLAYARQVSIQNDGYLRVEQGDWKGYEIGMTRALGHKLLAKFGVLITPSISLRMLQSTDLCLILASDGVWDAYNYTEAVNLVLSQIAQGKTSNQAAEVLVECAVERLHKRSIPADNTTAIVFIFKQNIS